MPLDGDRLGTAIHNSFQSYFNGNISDDTPVTIPQLLALWKLLANDIVNEITSNATMSFNQDDFTTDTDAASDYQVTDATGTFPVVGIADGKTRSAAFTGQIS